jgi:predicted aminopeptidase
MVRHGIFSCTPDAQGLRHPPSSTTAEACASSVFQTSSDACLTVVWRLPTVFSIFKVASERQRNERAIRNYCKDEKLRRQ